VGHLLVLVTQREEHLAQAQAAAAAANFHRCLCLTLPCVWDAPRQPPRFINRDSCAYLLSLQQQQSAPQDFSFLDLRRHDERALYGGIPGAVHVPVETFVFAVQRDAAAFAAACHVPKPPPDELLILQCRSNRRSAWAARVAEEHGAQLACAAFRLRFHPQPLWPFPTGYSRVLVYKQGSHGWRLDPGVQAYPSYEPGEEPPEPEDVPLESMDGNAAIEELKALGIEI